MPTYGLQITQEPSAEPVSTTEAKAHLRVDITDDDTYIGALITAARQEAEAYLRRALVTQKWQMTLDQFPSVTYNTSQFTWYAPAWGTGPGSLSTLLPDGTTGSEIYLPWPKLQSVDEVTYVDPDGVTQTMNLTTGLIVDAVSEPARLTPPFDAGWPATRKVANAVSIKFTCGYGNAAAVPTLIKQWILLRVATLYETREGTNALVGVNMNIATLPFVETMLNRYRVVRFG